MCTSFIKKTENNTFIAMNFDNNGMKYTVNTKKKDWFIVYVDAGKVKAPSFGVHKSGVFFNNQVVDFNEKGKYRRSKGVVHSTKFLLGIIDGSVDPNNLKGFLEETEIVNVPDCSTHNMITSEEGNVFIIEPGIGNIYKELEIGDFQIMTNEPIIDENENKNEFSCYRYNIVKKHLIELEEVDVNKIFEVLSAIKQNNDEWKTDFSMVYDKKRETVYFCENQSFKDIKEFSF